jgi:hypothetical protein
MRNKKPEIFATDVTKNSNSSSWCPPGFTSDVNLPAPKIRKEICGGVSAVSFWRWRHNPNMGCPPLTEIMVGSTAPVSSGWAGGAAKSESLRKRHCPARVRERADPPRLPHSVSPTNPSPATSSVAGLWMITPMLT